jgi:ABC-type transport system involved in multi-copper enzyme maturation permease subunit
MTGYIENPGVCRSLFDLNPVFQVARNEFSMLMDQPLTLIIATVILVIALIHAIGDIAILPQSASLFPPGEVFITMGMNNSFWFTTLFLSFLSLCIGIISISGERSNGAIHVLLTKPLFRRDVIAGKFIGGSLFMVTTVIITLIVCVISMLITYRGTLPYFELFIRTCAYGVILSIYCLLTLGIAMVIGSFFKDRAVALIAAFCYLYFALIEKTFFKNLGSMRMIDPYFLYTTAFSPINNTIFDMSGTISSWLGSAMPYIALLILEVVAVFLLNCVIFNREET